ncbi:hypothetical protein JRI60_49340 [Archangium violaceum]|uniref:hypothetical protein n=1 Tax=Archangium violaceum TaxID=83451 RepID=UPI001951C613|nr:hypothetical protein [Archangium violaceum]QRN96893.1 hypothetical protein JRI60_49340 [Archangium violaceum]
MAGLPLDPVLASLYARLGHAAFATKVNSWVLTQFDDEVNRLEENNKWWQENYWDELGEPVIVFGGDVYAYATVPGLMDARGMQPVVEVNTYDLDGPKVMPVASNVDRFFDSYSRYLEALVAHPGYQESGETVLTFPWDAAGILARDERLVELMRAGRFDALMKHVDDSTRRWAAKVMGTRA